MLLSSPTVRELERLTARVYATREAGARLDAYRRDGEFFLDIDLPGFDDAAIDIEVDSKVLTVRAERRRSDPAQGGTAVAERGLGNFSREVSLAETLDTDRLEARYDNGVLLLRIPVVKRAPREI